MGTGVAPVGNPPVSWSESENIRWKVALPGHGASTPIVWGDRVFVLAAAPASGSTAAEVALPGSGQPRVAAPSDPYAFKVLCLDRNTGKTRWEQTAVTAVPHEGRHVTASFAPYSPVTDGERLWVSFGSRGLYCYDIDGALQWKSELPEMSMRYSFGEGSSPALAGDVVAVVADHEGQSAIIALDKVTGREVWRKERDEPSAWATPLVHEANGVLEIITSATERVRSYDARTGEVIWSCGGLLVNAIPTPVIGDGVVYCMNGHHRGAVLLAIALGKKGDLTDTDAVRWKLERGVPYVASPLLYEGRLYLLDYTRGRLGCYKAKDGTPLYTRKSLGDVRTVYASPVGAAGHIYIAGRKGSVAVLRSGETFEVLATNLLDDEFDASPAIVEDTLFLRGSHHLYCIGKP